MKQYVARLITIFVLLTAWMSNAWAVSNGTVTTDGEFYGKPLPLAENHNIPDVVYPKNWVPSNGSEITDFEFEERILDKEVITEKTDRYEIKLAKDVSYSIEINPTSEAINRSLGFSAPDYIKKQYAEMGWRLPPEVNSLEPYESLSHGQQIRFRQMRLDFLRGAARILHFSQWGMTAGMLTKDTLSYSYKKIFRKEFTPQEKTLKERRHAFIQNFLTSLNHRLFFQAPLVVNMNEFGIPVSLGIIGLSGARNKGFGGLVELGFSIGYNREQKVFVFEFNVIPEKFHHSLAAASVVGINYKVGAYMSSTPAKNGTKTIKNVASFYPPMIPGFSSATSSFASFGFSSGFGFPPPPLADFLTFNLTGERYKIVRITVPRFLINGFPRISFGEVGQLMVVAKSGVIGTAEFLTKRFQVWQNQRACRNTFSF